jgi:hypothetical protein
LRQRFANRVALTPSLREIREIYDEPALLFQIVEPKLKGLENTEQRAPLELAATRGDKGPTPVQHYHHMATLAAPGSDSGTRVAKLSQ